MIDSMIRVSAGQLSFLDHFYADSLSLADNVIRSIGDDWEASKRELQRLDFKETPDTALPLEVRAKRNLGKARKEFLGLVAETAACLANAQGGVIVLGIRDAAPS